MKISVGKIILVLIVIYFIVFGIININKQKDDNKDILENVVYVNNGIIDNKNDNKLVLVCGKIKYDKLVSFTELKEDFGTIKINRTVEDYLKVYDEDNKYEYKWVERKEPLNSENNEYLKEIISTTKTSNIMIGDYKLDEKGLNLVPTKKYYKDQETIGDLVTTGLSYEKDPDEEDIKEGDMRITYKYYDLEKNPYLSILAMQKGNSFVPYKSKNNEVYKLFVGNVNNREKLEKELKKGVKRSIKGKTLFILIILGIGIFLIVDNRKKKE